MPRTAIDESFLGARGGSLGSLVAGEVTEFVRRFPSDPETDDIVQWVLGVASRLFDGAPAWLLASSPGGGASWRLLGACPEIAASLITVPPDDPSLCGAVDRLSVTRFAPPPARWQLAPTAGVAEIVLLPLRIGNHLRGFLAVGPSYPVLADQVALFEVVGAQAALALELVEVSVETRSRQARLEASVCDLEAAQGRLVRVERLRALGEMASGVAHDFNNLLNVILHWSALLHPSVDESARHGLDRIERAAQHGADTVRRLQDFTRQRRDTNFRSVDLARVVGDATRVAWASEGVRSETLRLEVDVAPELPTVMGEPSELVEVVANLISNALDAMPRGGLLQVAVRSLASGKVVITVRDTGVGMDSTTRERAFDPFFTTKGVRGTGLGLSVVYGIVQRHGGEVSIDSEPGRGTVVRVLLPAHTLPAGDVVEAPRVPEARDLLPAVRVLLIEDDEANREATSALLQHAGLSVVEAASGNEGVAAFRPGEFDLVLSDLGMPDRSGWEVARAIKEQDASVPIALITGWGLTLSEEEGRRRGIDLIIQKPVGPQRLLDLLGDLLREGR